MVANCIDAERRQQVLTSESVDALEVAQKIRAEALAWGGTSEEHAHLNYQVLAEKHWYPGLRKAGIPEE